MGNNVLKAATKAALAVGGAGVLIGSGSALAQSPQPTHASNKRTKLSQIVVTGSHIPRTSIATAQPVITIDRQEINNTGFTTVGELLQNMSSAGSALNVQYNNGGNGAELVNLHDLGANRVLVLVNGQRWIPTLSGAVDLTTIPLSVVDRIEVLLDGASAVYGSEAIAGVINIITKRDYNGAQAHGYYGAYDGHGDGGGWDGKTQKYSFTVGTSNERSGVLLSGGYYQQQAIWAGQRTISKEPRVGFGNQNGSAGTPGGRFLIMNTAGSNVASCTPSVARCDLSGPDANNPSGYHQWTNADRYNFAPANYLRTPQERWDIFSQGHYDLTDNVTFTFTTTYQRRNSSQVLAPNPWFFGLFSGKEANGLKIGMAKNAPGNPFGADLVPYRPTSSGFATWCNRFGSPTCSSNYDVLLLYGRRPVEVGNRDFSENNQTFYFNGGFNGYWQMLNNQWTWNANYIYSQVLDTRVKQGWANTARLQQALSYNCANEPGCVPLNLFGGAGTITPAMGNYVMFTAHRVIKEVLRDYNATVAGQLMNGWYAGPWGVAAGYEYEAYDGFDQPDALVSEGNTIGNVTQPTNGRENTNAEFVELHLPLAKHMAFAKELGIDVAERWSQFHWNGIGNVLNATTQTVGTGTAAAYAHSATPRVTLKWRPVADFLVRGTWAQGFRIPSLSELFFGASDNHPAVVDPCAVAASQLPAGCNGVVHVQPNPQIRTTVGGNAYLHPEKATTRTAGFVYSPTFLPNFDFSADYYKTEVVRIIQSAGAQYYLDDCYVAQNPTSCQHIVVTGGAITNIINLLNNGGSRKVEGWDLAADYRFPVTPIGQFSVRATANFMQSDVYCSINGQCTEEAGSAGPSSETGSRFGQPKHRYNVALDWNYGAWSAVYRIRIIGPMWEDCTQSELNTRGRGGGAEGVTATSPRTFGWCSKIVSYTYDSQGTPFSVKQGINQLGTTVYSDVQCSYTVRPWNATFTLGVNNLFDKQPPISRSTFANSYLPMYDTPGRFVYARVAVHF